MLGPTEHVSAGILHTANIANITGNSEEDHGIVLGGVLVGLKPTQDTVSLLVVDIARSLSEAGPEVIGEAEGVAADLVAVEPKP